jgi:integrase
MLRIKGSPFWYIRYSKDGVRYQESTKSTVKDDAKRLLRRREGAIEEGRFPGLRATRTRIAELVALGLVEAEEQHRKSLKEFTRFAALLKEHFGALRAANLTTSMVADYRARRRAGSLSTKAATGKRKLTVADSTINREISWLRHCYHLGTRHDPPLVGRVPHFEIIREHNVRHGFFTHEEFAALRGALPDYAKVVVTLGYYTGCRKGEVLHLRWAQVDWDSAMIRLAPGTTKNGEGRQIPLVPEVRSMLALWRRDTLRRYPQCEWVCHYHGRRLTRLDRSWKRACKTVGLEGRLFHDFRRTAGRNLIRAGVPEVVAMRISGHKTRSVFDRYNIVSEADLTSAADRLVGYLAAEKGKIGVNSLVTDTSQESASDTQPPENAVLVADRPRSSVG